MDENDMQAQNAKSKSDRKECSYCKTPIYDSMIMQSWKTDKGDPVILCTKCNQSYISGLIEPGSENKKVARYIMSTISGGQALNIINNSVANVSTTSMN